MPRKKRTTKKAAVKKPQIWKTSKIQRAAMAAIMRENQSRHLQIIEDIKEDLGINPDTPVQFPQTTQGIDLAKLVEIVTPADLEAPDDADGPTSDAPEGDDAA